MRTIKLPIQTDVTSYLREFNFCMRTSYNRFVEGFEFNEIRLQTSLGCWLAGCAIEEGENWFKKNPDGKMIFGGKKNLKLRAEGKISKEEWRSQICISFDEAILREKEIELDDHRVFAVDLNPNNIGYSVLEFDKNDKFRVVSKGLVDLSQLNKKLKLAASDPRQKKQTNKRHYELVQVSKRFVELATHFQCSKFVVEELNMKPQDHGYGRAFNRLVNNVWSRNLVLQSLQKHSNIFGIEFVTINPMYSSVIGNVVYANEATPDSIASSIEIGRRGYKKFSKNWFYPKLIAVEALQNRWKEAAKWKLENWKELFRELKNAKVKYRVSFEETIFSRVFQFKSSNSRVLFYEFGR